MEPRRVDRKFTTYDRDAIARWKAEIERIPAEITQHENEIAGHQRKIEEVVPFLQDLNTTRIAPLDSYLQELNAQICYLINPSKIAALSAQKIPHIEQMNIIFPRLEGVKSQIASIDLEIKRLNTLISIQEAHTRNQDLLPQIREHLEDVRRKQEEAHRHMLDLIDLASRRDQAKRDLTEIKSKLKPVEGLDAAVIEINKIDNAKFAPAVGILESRVIELETSHRSKEKAVRRLKEEIKEIQANCTRKEEEVRANERRMAELRAQLQESGTAESLIALKLQLERKQSERKSLEPARDQLQRDYTLHFTANDNLQQEIERLTQEYNRALGSRGQFEGYTNIHDLNAKLQLAQADRKSLSEEQSRLNDIIGTHQGDIAVLQQAINAKNTRRSTLLGNLFLVKLTDHKNPFTLTQELISALRLSLEKFDLEHPAGQSLNTRACIAETLKKLNPISQMAPESETASRLKLYQICGMLWQILDKADGGNDFNLAETLVSVLRQFPVDPDEAREAYVNLHKIYRDTLSDVKPSDLEALEASEFTRAVNSLSDAIREIPDTASKYHLTLRRNGQTVLANFRERMNRESVNGPAGADAKYFIIVLNHTAKLLRDPGNRLLRREYHSLASHNTHGQPSLTKKICGAMLMFLGSALGAARYALSSVPREYAPYTFIGGGLLFVAGIGLFGSGMRKGTAKSLDNVEKAADKVAMGLR